MSHPSRWMPIGQIALIQKRDSLLVVTTFYVHWRDPIEFKTVRWTHTAPDEGGKEYRYRRGRDGFEHMQKDYKKLTTRENNPHRVAMPLSGREETWALIQKWREQSQRTDDYFGKAS